MCYNSECRQILVFVLVRCYFLNLFPFNFVFYRGGKRTTVPPPMYATEIYFTIRIEYCNFLNLYGVRTIRSSAWSSRFHNYFLIDATDRSKISSLYPLSFFANTLFKQHIFLLTKDVNRNYFLKQFYKTSQIIVGPSKTTITLHMIKNEPSSTRCPSG